MRIYNDFIICNNKIIAKSYAKINLTLDVVSRRDNGYHDVEMVMQTVNLYDTVTVEKCSEGIILNVNSPMLPTDERNIAYKAASLFFSECKISGGALISIDKNIPIAAGLAGGSSNAAAVLCSLNILYGTNLPDEELARLGLLLGADVPYCIYGGTCLAEGIGERLTELKGIPPVYVLLVKPEKGVSTAEIYHTIDSSENLLHPDTKGMLEAIEKSDIYIISRYLSNIMENVTSKINPEIKEIKSEMIEAGAIGAVMSGSGPTVFGFFENLNTAKSAAEVFSKKYSEVFITRTYN